MQVTEPAAKPRTRLNRRTLLIGLPLVAAGFLYGGSRLASQLVGDPVSPPFAAPGFTLTDQFGHPRTLSAFRGHPIAVTFIYTNCPDTCPLIASNFHSAYQKLGAEARDVTLLAVTVDPERDTVAQVRQFSEQHQLLNEWLFLTGSRPQLEQVWKSYGILSQYLDAGGNRVTPQNVAQASADTLEHSAPVFLIDKRGQVRALLMDQIRAEDLATDLRILLAEPTSLSDLPTSVRANGSELVATGANLVDTFAGPQRGPAPDVRLSLFGGGTFQLAEQRGKVVVMNYWASWCPPCRAEAPRLQAAAQAYRSRGVVFVGVDVSDTSTGAQAFLQEFGITYPNGPDQGLANSEAYGVTGLPMTFVIDRQGQISQRWEGEIQAEQLTGFIDEALR